MTDRAYLVLTAVGPDRPGLVNEISQLIHRSGANLEDSRMAILGGEFALLLLISGPEPALAKVEQEGPTLGEQLGLKLMLKRTLRQATPRDFLPYEIRVTGVDRPGIVYAVANALAKRGINVASLDSRVSYAPLSGTPMFTLEADLQIPSEVALSELRRELSSVCDEENLDFTLEAKS